MVVPHQVARLLSGEQYPGALGQPQRGWQTIRGGTQSGPALAAEREMAVNTTVWKGRRNLERSVGATLETAGEECSNRALHLRTCAGSENSPCIEMTVVL